MRLSALLIPIALIGCSKSTTETPPTGSAPPPKPVDTTPKKPVDKRPLPPLDKDPGGATGKPVSGIGFGGLGIDAPTGIALGKDGEVYLSGYFDAELEVKGIGKKTPTPADPPKPKTKPPAPPSDAYLARVEADGKIAWMQTWGDKREDVARAVAINGDTIVVVGNFLDRLDIGDKPEQSKNPSNGSDDLYAAAFDKTGKSLWVWNMGGIDSDGGWYIGGSFRKTIKINDVEYQAKGKSDALLVKLDKTGKVEWHKEFGGNYDDTIMHMTSDVRGNIYVQGHFRDKSDWGGTPLIAAGGADNDIVLAKYDANGDHQWSKRFGNAFDDVAGGVAVDPAGNVTIVGSFDRAVSFGEGDDHVSNGEADIYIARFDGTGKLVWAKTYGSDRPDIAWGVAADSSGNVVATGWFEGSVDFGKTSLGAIKSNGNKDVFAIKHDPNGAVVWVTTWGDKDHDQGRAVAIDAKGGAIVAGLYRFALSAVNPPLESVRAEGDRIPKPDTFVLRLER